MAEASDMVKDGMKSLKTLHGALANANKTPKQLLETCLQQIHISLGVNVMAALDAYHDVQSQEHIHAQPYLSLQCITPSTSHFLTPLQHQQQHQQLYPNTPKGSFKYQGNYRMVHLGGVMPNISWHKWELVHRIVCLAIWGPPKVFWQHDSRGHKKLVTKHVCMHLCNNPECLNPWHLAWGSYSENDPHTMVKPGVLDEVVKRRRRQFLQPFI